MTQKQAVLRLFEMCQGTVTTAQFCAYMYHDRKGNWVGLGNEWRARLTELRRKGYVILRGERAGEGWAYRLVSVPKPVERAA